jgi:hypothetical protein
MTVTITLTITITITITTVSGEEEQRQGILGEGKHGRVRIGRGHSITLQ